MSTAIDTVIDLPPPSLADRLDKCLGAYGVPGADEVIADVAELEDGVRAVVRDLRQAMNALKTRPDTDVVAVVCDAIFELERLL